MGVTGMADWRAVERDRTLALFRRAWEGAPSAGRAALIEAASRGRVGHRWERGRSACVLALLAAPALRPRETAKAGAYRLFGCEATDDLPVTWDAGGVTLVDLLRSVGVPLEDGGVRRGGRWLARPGAIGRELARAVIRR